MIEVEHLTKFHGPHPAVQDVSFRVERGEILGFLGPNGAGKTTTMRILTGFIPATSGRAAVAGFDVEKDPLEVRRRVGYLPESVPLYVDMEVKPYLSFVAELKGVERARRASAVAEVVERFDLGDVVRQRIGSLSKGYRQRVGLAQALLNDPEVLILDEPTIGLDPRQISEIRGMIRQLGGHRTVILSTHILPEVSMTCGRVVIINRGRVAAMGTPASLTASQERAGRFHVQLLGPRAEAMARLERVPGVARVLPDGEAQIPLPADAVRLLVESVPGQDPRGELARSVVEAGWTLQELRPLVLSLEDIFLQLVTSEEEVAA